MSKQKITTSQVLGLLDQGMKRSEIAEELGLTKTEVTKLFQHPKLKGKKAKKPVSFILEDDLEDDTPSEVPTTEIENSNVSDSSDSSDDTLGGESDTDIVAEEEAEQTWNN